MGNGGAHNGVFLGNFNYDIERSVQTYTVPIHGLTQGEKVEYNIRNYENEDSKCMNAIAHAGHGFVSGCSTNATATEDAVCSNSLTFTQDPSHNGLLEYFQFEPVSPANSPDCFFPLENPTPYEDDYQWLTPSPWDTQEEYEPHNFWTAPYPWQNN